MAVLIWPFKILALLGACLTLFFNVVLLLRIPLPADWGVPMDMLLGWLSGGIFVVWIPTVLLVARMQNAQGTMRMSWRELLAGCPEWMRYTVYGLFAYALINFLFMIGTGVNDSLPNPALQPWRVMMGHGMLFYGAAFAVMYSVTQKPRLMKTRTCVAGHAVGMNDSFCPQCGQKLLPEDD